MVEEEPNMVIEEAQCRALKKRRANVMENWTFSTNSPSDWLCIYKKIMWKWNG